MRALLHHQPGDVEEMTIGEIPASGPGPGEIRVAMYASGLNPSDFQRAAYDIPGAAWPFVMGIDVAGTVEAIGEGVAGFSIGDRVACHNDIRRRGGFAESTVVDARALAHVPDSVPLVSAAAVASAGLTAFQVIDRRLGVVEHDTVLITGAGGGVGGYATQLASKRGARVIAVDAGDREEFVRSLGADVFIDYRTQDIAHEVRHATGGRGVDAVLDTAGTASATTALGLLAYSGRIATTAGAPDLTAVNPVDIGLSWHAIATGIAHLNGTDRDRAELAQMIEELLQLVADGDLDPMISKTIPLEEVAQTLAAMARFEVRGKVVAVIQDEDGQDR